MKLNLINKENLPLKYVMNLHYHKEHLDKFDVLYEIVSYLGDNGKLDEEFTLGDLYGKIHKGKNIKDEILPNIKELIKDGYVSVVEKNKKMIKIKFKVKKHIW